MQTARSIPDESRRHPREGRRWGRMFEAAPREHAFERLTVEGELPADLRVTAYFNGPGHFDRFGQRYQHWFDGDGTIAAVRVAGGRAEGAYRTTASRDRRIEQMVGRRLFSAYGTGSAWPLTVLHPSRRVKSSANTAILCRDGKVFALMEGARPVRIDPHSLTALGPTDLGVTEMRNYSAHPVRLPSGRVLSTGLRISKEDHVDLFMTTAGVTRRIAEVPLAYPTMVHSFAATETHALLMMMPLRLRKFHFLFNVGSFADNMVWEPERGTELIVVPLDDPSRLRRISIDPFFFWHVAQSFESSGRIVADLIRYPDWANSAWLAELPRGGAPPIEGGRAFRLSVELASGDARIERRSNVLAEFPVASPACRGREAPVIFCGHETSGAMTGMIDSLIRLDLSSGEHRRFDLGADEAYPSEVQVVPRGEAADDAWVIALVYDPASERSYLGVWDGLAPEAGPVAKAWFDHHVPGRFHGDYLPL